MMKTIQRLLVLSLLPLSLQGCVGFIVGTAVDVAIEVAKVPFKVGAAVVDVATGGDSDKKEEKK